MDTTLQTTINLIRSYIDTHPQLAIKLLIDLPEVRKAGVYRDVLQMQEGNYISKMDLFYVLDILEEYLEDKNGSK